MDKLLHQHKRLQGDEYKGANYGSPTTNCALPQTKPKSHLAFLNRSCSYLSSLITRKKQTMNPTLS